MSTRRDRLIGERVEVCWEDAAGAGGGWISSYELHQYGVSLCQSCGYLVSRNKRQIQLALSRTTSPDLKPWAEVQSIPMSAVRSIHKVTKLRRQSKTP